MKQEVLCLCNFGLVRSKTMANRLNARGIKAKAAGMINTNPQSLQTLMIQAGTVLVCNKPNVEENFIREHIPKVHARVIRTLLEKYKDKVIVVDTIGRDKWAQENHPDLVNICDTWLAGRLP